MKRMTMKIMYMMVLGWLTSGFGVLHAAEKPFAVSIVPEDRDANGARIRWTKSNKRNFYVVLSNVTANPQPVFEDWNSWGYQSISFDLVWAGGKTAKVKLKPQNFTRNAPSTYTLLPKGHQVFLITFNEEWEGKPNFKEAWAKVKLKAIYEIRATKESKEIGVWVGRIESEQIDVTIVNR